MTNSSSFAGIQNLSAALADLVAGVAPSIVAIRSDSARFFHLMADDQHTHDLLLPSSMSS